MVVVTCGSFASVSVDAPGSRDSSDRLRADIAALVEPRTAVVMGPIEGLPIGSSSGRWLSHDGTTMSRWQAASFVPMMSSCRWRADSFTTKTSAFTSVLINKEREGDREVYSLGASVPSRSLDSFTFFFPKAEQRAKRIFEICPWCKGIITCSRRKPLSKC